MQLQQRSNDLAAFLASHRPIWTERAFTSDHLSWEAKYPELVTWLVGLPPEALVRFECDPPRLCQEAPPPLRDLAAAALRLTDVPSLCVSPPPLDRHLAWRIRQRKQRQVAAFAAYVASGFSAQLEFVDWCAGKGHLGRLLNRQHGRRVLCIEQNPVLCEAGQQLDARAGADNRWLSADIHGDRARAALCGRAAVALHACGELHRDLVQRGAQPGGFEALALAPCCYHNETHAVRDYRERPSWRLRLRLPPAPVAFRYAPLSAAGQANDPQLDENTLRLASSDEVVASPRIMRRRERAQAFRLGADALLRAVSGEDRYHPLPPFPTRWLSGDFTTFVASLSDALELTLPGEDLDGVERRARKRVLRVRALGLMRGVFRRPVELWLALDSALYLQERGFDVSLGTFCDRAVTPRNLCLLATRG